MKTTITIQFEWWNAGDPKKPIPVGHREEIIQIGLKCATTGMDYGDREGEHLVTLPKNCVYRGHWRAMELTEG